MTADTTPPNGPRQMQLQQERRRRRHRGGSVGVKLKDIKILLNLLHSTMGMFVSDITTNMQFRKMQNEIYGSLVYTIQ